MLKDWPYNNSWQWPKHLPSLFWHCHDFVHPSQQNHCTHWISKPTLRWTLNSSYSNFSCFAIFMLTQRRICNVDASQVLAAAVVWICGFKPLAWTFVAGLQRITTVVSSDKVAIWCQCWDGVSSQPRLQLLQDENDNRLSVTISHIFRKMYCAFAVGPSTMVDSYLFFHFLCVI